MPFTKGPSSSSESDSTKSPSALSLRVNNVVSLSSCWSCSGLGDACELFHLSQALSSQMRDMLAEYLPLRLMDEEDVREEVEEGDDMVKRKNRWIVAMERRLCQEEKTKNVGKPAEDAMGVFLVGWFGE